MARQRNYSEDTNLTGLDKLTGVKAENNQTANYTLDSIAEFLAQTGNSDGTRAGFLYTYNGAYTETDNSLSSQRIKIEYKEDTPSSNYSFSTVETLYISAESEDNSDFEPIRAYIVSGILKITNVTSVGSRGYGIYRVTASERVDNTGASDNSGDFIKLDLRYLGSAGNIGLDKLVLSPFGAGQSSGADPEEGDQLFVDSGAPASSLGQDGDLYIDSENFLVYGPKAGGSWGSGRSFKGEEGEKGDPGVFNSFSATAETVEPNEPAAVRTTVNTDAGTVALEFDIPKGEQGEDGEDGEAGRGISSIVYDTDSREFTVTYTDGTSSTFSGIGGQDGMDGATILSGTVDPTDSDGVEGDYFFNTTSKVFFGPKGETSWPATGTNLDGAQGDPGDPVDNVVYAPGGEPTNPGDNTIIQFQVNGSQVGSNITIAGGEKGDDGDDGTQVTANTGDSNDTALTSITIDGTDYSIPSGGGGGTQYTFQNNGVAVSDSSVINTINFSTNATAVQSGSTLTISSQGGGGGGSQVTATANNGDLQTITIDGTTYTIDYSPVVSATGSGGDLATITVDGTSYNVPSGGGGSDVQVNGDDVSLANFIDENAPGGITWTADANGIEGSVNSKNGNNSNASTGQILTADGSGGVEWDDAPTGTQGDWNQSESDEPDYIRNKPTTITNAQAQAIVDNSAKTGITPEQANAIAANTLKQTNVDTDISVTRQGDTITIVSSDGNDGTFGVASTSTAGAMSSGDKSKLDNIEANAEVNQFAYSSITVGSDELNADDKQDELIFVAGDGITLSTNNDDAITIASTAQGGLDKYEDGVDYAADDVIWNEDDDKIYVVDTAITAADNTQFSAVDTTELSALPVATNTELGGVIVPASSDIDVDSNGNITLGDLAASKITSGVFPAARISSDTPAANEVLSYDGTDVVWVAQSSGVRAVTIDGHAIENNETLALTEGTNVTIDESNGQATFNAGIQVEHDGSSDQMEVYKLNFTGAGVQVGTKNSDGTVTITITGDSNANDNTPPVVTLSQTGFSADSHEDVDQTITFNAAVTANDGTITQVEFSDDGSQFDVTDQNSPYTSGAQPVSFSSNSTVVVTATVSYHYGDQNDILTVSDSITLTVDKDNPVYAPSYTYGSNFAVAPTDSRIEAFDTGTITASELVDESDNNGWNIDGSVTYNPTLNADREFDVASSADDENFTATASWTAADSNSSETLTNYQMLNHEWTKVRSIRAGGKADTTPFTAAAMMDIDTYAADIQSDNKFVSNPDGLDLPLYRDGGEYLYFAYDAQYNDVDLMKSTESGFPINGGFVKETGTPGGFKVYRSTSTGSAVTGDITVSIVLE